MRSRMALLSGVALGLALLLTAAPALAAEGEHATGPPLGLEADLALWSGVTFIVFVFVLKKLAWKPLISGLDSRESGIRRNIAEAEAARQKAQNMLAEHEQRLSKVQDEVKEILAEARRDAERTRQDILADAQSEAEAVKRRSIAEIERARDVALRDVFDSLSNQVVVATEHVLGRALNDDDKGRLVDEALSQFAGSPD
jgi:F-type H+-transporting ATPase subunit b